MKAMYRRRRILRRMIMGEASYGSSGLQVVTMPVLALALAGLAVPGPGWVLSAVLFVVAVILLLIAFLFFLTIVGAPAGAALV